MYAFELTTCVYRFVKGLIFFCLKKLITAVFEESLYDDMSPCKSTETVKKPK